MERNEKSLKINGDISAMAELPRSAADVSINISPEEDVSKQQNDGFPSPEIKPTLHSSNKPPKIPEPNTLTRRKYLTRSVSLKAKSRFGEPSIPIDNAVLDEGAAQGSPRDSPSSKTTPLRASSKALDEEEEIYKKVRSRKKLRYRKVKAKVLIEWLFLLSFLGSLISSLTVHKLKVLRVWNLPLWKWFLLVFVTFSGMLVTKWFMDFVVLLIELNFLLRKKVLYFVYGLKRSVQVFIWLNYVLITWIVLFHKRGSVNDSTTASRILEFISWTIVSLLVGSFLWFVKTLSLKVLASTFHVNTFFDRIQEAIFHQYVLMTLSGPPVMESAQMLGKTSSVSSRISFRINKTDRDGKKKGTRIIDMSKLHRMKHEKVSALTMKMLIDVISNSGLTTLSTTIEESFYDRGDHQTDNKEITNDEEAIAAAYEIFRNVAQPCSTYLDEHDFRRFMIREQVEIVFPMIDVGDTGKIDRKTLTEWVLKVYRDRKALAHALNDTKTAVKQLNKLISAILIVIVFVIWLLLTGIATTKVLVFMSSQLVLAAFMFGNTCKTIFEALIFVFVMHPFDVGDRCVIDGVQMVVEEMNILTTVFLKADNEKVYYPNSVLATKPISNFYRSPDMKDSLEFSIAFKTPAEKIGLLKEKIKKYLEGDPHRWHPNHSVVVKDIEDVNKLRMILFFNYTMNYHDITEKNRRRTDVVMEVKRIFEELGIGYALLPQLIDLREQRYPDGQR
ncbi:hypothetical protein M569_07594 [Genlisea aurea]|uniref:Mechanosensitive ion channel protein n=1 Tax=Genlisea aurea TaxID=192259 RepID=S8CQN1_9LAMI|nr:hypothetical protein M569_07594 [Genlisea aurea]